MDEQGTQGIQRGLDGRAIADEGGANGTDEPQQRQGDRNGIRTST
jgi:hypothetical protein